jgi:hypothetical protein
MYYVYELIDPRNLEPFYVGKGLGNRASFHLSECSRVKTDNQRKYNKIQKIRKYGYEPIVNIIKYFENENDAYDYEECLIKKYGRIRYDNDGILTNICESSRPPSHKGKTYKEIYGDDWMDQVRKRLKTKYETGNFGGVKKHTEESKRKISQKVSGKNNPSYGVPCSEERKRKISENAKERYKNGFKSSTSVTYILTDSNGNDHEVFGELKKFCKENNISYATMCAAIKYERGGPRRNGWSIKKKV